MATYSVPAKPERVNRAQLSVCRVLRSDTSLILYNLYYHSYCSSLLGNDKLTILGYNVC